jgi:hypothetical protein
MKNIYYLWSEIAGGNCPVKEEVPTFSHFLFWYIILIIGTMKEIKLSRGLSTQVDDEDYEYLNQWKWCILHPGNNYYAMRRLRGIKPIKYEFMHRIIMNTPIGMEIDHIDFNGLNNQKMNLRICTHQQNNCHKKARGISKYVGVTKTLDKTRKNVRLRIIAQITFKGNHIYIGDFKTEEDAARAYDEAAQKYFGEFANLNFK